MRFYGFSVRELFGSTDDLDPDMDPKVAWAIRNLEMFPVEVRFTGAGVGFQAAGILGGAIAPTICVSLFSAWQSTVPVVVYLTILLLLAYVCVYTTKTE